MARPIFTAVGDHVVDRIGNRWTVEQAETRLHLIAGLLADPKESQLGVEVGLERFTALAAAIRTAKESINASA
jgi:hypothetical protein